MEQNNDELEKGCHLHHIAVAETIIGFCRMFFLGLVTATLCYLWTLFGNLILIIVFEVITAIASFIILIFIILIIRKHAINSSFYSQNILDSNDS